MQNPHNGNRIGFLLSTIYSGSALKLWHKIVARASKDKGAFFIFPGGKLNSEKNTEQLRNSVYELANSSNLDGLISWASSISGSVSLQEVEEFHKRFKELPVVTIGQKLLGKPCSEFDAYSGMKELVLHFIKTHGVEKIVFLRGPQNHTSAEDRFRGFKDALSENGLFTEENQKLITEAMGWTEGEKAMVQLCEERNLVPGRDFKAIIGASDLMTFAAVNYLKKRGVRIPKDLLVGGFNDTEESRISVPAFSTVHMPTAELGVDAYEKLYNIINGMLGVSDAKLSAYPVIRESCGCNRAKIWNSVDSKYKIRSEAQFREELFKIFHTTPEQANLDPMLRALFDNDKPKFYELFSQWITKYFEDGGEALTVFTFLSALRAITDLSPDYIEKVIRHVIVSIPRIQERVLIQEQFEAGKINTIVSSLKNELLSVYDRPKLITVLKKYLDTIGIRTFALVIHDDENYSTYIGGYNATDEARTEPIRFQRGNLVPDKYVSDFANGAFVVQPLFDEEHAYGYIICSYAKCHGLVYEDLRSSVSSALQSINFFETTNEARKIAEQAEFAKTEFFANVGSDLCDPLKNLSSKVQQMEENIEKGVIDKDILAEQLLFLRSQINAQLQKTETLVDLTRSQVDDLPMNKKLYEIRQVLPGSIAANLNQEYPLLYGDAERLKRALQTIFDYAEKIPCISEKIDGIHIEFYSSRFDWHKPELLLAEKIILLQFGDVEKSNSYAEVLLPWPNLAGLPPENFDVGKAKLYCFNEEFSKEKFELSPKYLFEEGYLETDFENSVFYWEPDIAPIDEWIKIYGLRKKDSVFRAPIICYSHNLIGHNFTEMLEQKIKAQRSSPVLFVGAKHTHYGSWATESNTVTVASMAEFDDILNEITPSLIVFEKITEENIRRIRQNQKTVLVPIIVLPDTISSDEEVELLCSHPRIILCNRGAAESEQFNERIKAILAGDEILPPHTGALVKKAILYLNRNASKQIVRWKLADTVHVSEDYLTRIFHKEIGLSLWEYLNRYRIYIATKMLLETNDTIYEIAENSGFQDQAYFCRVFKKIYGIPPGKIRSKQ